MDFVFKLKFFSRWEIFGVFFNDSQTSLKFLKLQKMLEIFENFQEHIKKLKHFLIFFWCFKKFFLHKIKKSGLTRTSCYISRCSLSPHLKQPKESLTFLSTLYKKTSRICFFYRTFSCGFHTQQKMFLIHSERLFLR